MAKMYEYVIYKMRNSLENYNRFGLLENMLILVIHEGYYTKDKNGYEVFKFGKDSYVFKYDMGKLFKWTGSERIYSSYELSEDELINYFGVFGTKGVKKWGNKNNG